MTHVSAIFSEEDLQSEIINGWVRVQTSPNNRLFIYNYTEKAQFEKHWNPVTLNCRGLILDHDMNIVARPWKKFFNYGEGRLMIDDHMPVQVTDKMDGSLGILYRDSDGVWRIATRGSFNSDQAIHATKVLDTKYPFVAPDANYTFLFEIIYPKNRIVLNYGDMDDLVLLGAVHIERGYYLGPQEAAGILGWTGPMTQTFDYKNMAEAFAAPMRENAEGLVVRSGTEMVKIKQVDYVELHRVVTNLNERTIWARMAAGESLTQMAEYIPDEWHDYLNEVFTKLGTQFFARQEEVLDGFVKVRSSVLSEVGGRFDSIDRKTWAKHIVKSKDKAYFFALLDQKPVDQMIWAEIKPSIDKE